MKLAYSVPEAAETISVSRATLYRFIKDKTLPIVKIAGRTVIRAGDLDQFLADRLAA